MTDAFNPLAFDQIVQMQVDRFLGAPSVLDRGITDMTHAAQTMTLFEATAGPIEELMFAYGVDLPSRYFFDQAAANGADPDNLDRLVGNFTFGRVSRIPAAFAAGPVTFEAQDGTTIPDGTVFTSPDGTQVKALGTFQVAAGMGGVVVGVGQAVLAGTSGNLPLNTELTPVATVTGLTRAYISQAWTGGSNAQTNAELLDALLAWLDSLARGTVPAIIAGCEANGYPYAYVTEPMTGLVRCYVDDGAPANPVKLAACYASVFRFYRCAGANLKMLAPVPLGIPITAHVQPSPTATVAALQTAIAAAWAGVFSTLHQGDGLTLLRLYQAAMAVPGYNGVNIASPLGNLVAATATDEYNTVFTAGDVLPYQKLTLASVTWT